MNNANWFYLERVNNAKITQSLVCFSSMQRCVQSPLQHRSCIFCGFKPLIILQKAPPQMLDRVFKIPLVYIQLISLGFNLWTAYAGGSSILESEMKSLLSILKRKYVLKDFQNYERTTVDKDLVRNGNASCIDLEVFQEIRIWRSKMADTFTEENMKTLIEEIFQGEFKNQAENITNLISGK